MSGPTEVFVTLVRNVGTGMLACFALVAVIFIFGYLCDRFPALNATIIALSVLSFFAVIGSGILG